MKESDGHATDQGFARPVILIDSLRELHAAGLLSSDGAHESFARAYARAANWLGFDVTADHRCEDDAGFADDTIMELWQAAHDAVRERAPGCWVVASTAEELRQRGRLIRGGRRSNPTARTDGAVSP